MTLLQAAAVPDVASEPLWYKDAIIYELHVRAFADSNGDGIGDFRGLTERLDYLQQLGVTAIWLLPFYPSPLRDAGYDISDYTSINPEYGTMADFRRFVREAHRRGLRVITELVVNHTSDQHPWFRRAREAPPGSAERDWYVWSDDDSRYDGTRIIFTDTETSNWAWDPVAGQYFWHRFFSHQPDLNYANPQVRRAIERVMKFWFDRGVDGLRLDAVPYLCEREGTNNENLPETHEVLKSWRRYVDEYYPGRMLLAEANQWPQDVRPYFGDGDECHMAYHFPIMPRLYMALRQEDRKPLVDILRDTPDIPETCQWALFLRNHDELTLEMVSDEERSFMYSIFASDPRMRVNVGIRRRLAPLLDNNRRALELMHSLLYSLPGTPILYYGDEIAMGDNIYLGDRDSVRTPMQWSGDRNAGFSKSDPQRLYLPVIADPAFGYQATNVEAHERSASSFLNWQRRMLAVRGRRTVMARGDIQMLSAENRSILAFTRQYQGETMLVVANLSRFVQPLQLDLSAFAGHRPVEVIGQQPFPVIDETPYFLSLGPHGFYWLDLTPVAESQSEVSTEEFTVTGDWKTIFEPEAARHLTEDVLPPFLARQRWFGAKDERIEQTSLRAVVPFGQGPLPSWLVLVDVLSGGESTSYVLPLAIATGRTARRIREETPGLVVASVRSERGSGVLYDATASPAFVTALVEFISQRGTRDEGGATLTAERLRAFQDSLDALDEEPEISRLTAEQSNTSINVGGQFMLKLLRRFESDPHPEVEIGRHLQRHPEITPPLLGVLSLGIAAGGGDADPERGAILLAHQYRPSRRDGWDEVVSACRHFLDEHATEDAEPSAPEGALENAHAFLQIGQQTARMHLALADAQGDDDFAPQPFDAGSVEAVLQSIEERVEAIGGAIERIANSPDSRWAEMAQEAQRLLGSRQQSLAGLAADASDFSRIRIHGDYHLGQLLASGDTYYIVDFGGEVGEPIEHRRRRAAVFDDLAGMLRSFSYAARTAARASVETVPENPAATQRLAEWMRWWERSAQAAFLESYYDAVGDVPFLPSDRESRGRLLALFMVAKVLHELEYELAYRPDWVGIPLEGLVELLRDLDSRASSS